MAALSRRDGPATGVRYDVTPRVHRPIDVDNPADL
jgi:hypothetical protein